MNLIEYTPSADEWAHRFAGYPARLSMKPGDALRLGTEDCFGGRVRRPGDIPSEVVAFEDMNPSPGLFTSRAPSQVTSWPCTQREDGTAADH